jgi:hypothetical protein
MEPILVGDDGAAPDQEGEPAHFWHHPEDPLEDPLDLPVEDIPEDFPAEVIEAIIVEEEALMDALLAHDEDDDDGHGVLDQEELAPLLANPLPALGAAAVEGNGEWPLEEFRAELVDSDSELEDEPEPVTRPPTAGRWPLVMLTRVQVIPQQDSSSDEDV